MNALTKIAAIKVKAWITHQNLLIEQARSSGDHAKASALTAELHRRLKGGRNQG
jgi:hypothetical protein